MSKFDLNEVAALLHIAKEASGHPKLRNLRDEALKQLQAYNDEMNPPPEEPVEEPVEEPIEEEPEA